MKPIRYCEFCRKQLVVTKEKNEGYDSRTGKPVINYDVQCPDFKRSFVFIGNGHTIGIVFGDDEE